MTLIVPRMADWSSIESLKSFNETGYPDRGHDQPRVVSSSPRAAVRGAAAGGGPRDRGTGLGVQLSYDNQVLHLRLIHSYFRALFDRANRQAHENCNSTESRKSMRIHQSFLIG